MHIRIFGAVLIVISCSSVGYYLVLSHKREEDAIRQLINVLNFMECELQYRLTPLPELCRLAAVENRGIICDLMLMLANEMDRQISPDVASCMTAALSKFPRFPERAKRILIRLGGSLGRFDLSGQLKGLENARQTCRKELELLSNHRSDRLKNYQTLAICAGIALVILLV